MLAQLITQVLVFFVLLFSPITFPATQLPQWFQTVHDALPVLVAWTVVGIAVTLRALVRRQ